MTQDQHAYQLINKGLGYFNATEVKDDFIATQKSLLGLLSHWGRLVSHTNKPAPRHTGQRHVLSMNIAYTHIHIII